MSLAIEIESDPFAGVSSDTLERISCRIQAKGSLLKFVHYVGESGGLPVGSEPAAHHRLLIDALEAVERGDIRQLMVLMPPGSAKSTYASVLFPPWFMGRNPRHSALGVSNATELAEKWSRKVRNLVGSPDFRSVFGFGLNETLAAAGNWENERGGEYFAAGMGSAIAGRRADLGIIDDPIRSQEDADSERIREKQWDWYVSDFLTRLKPNARQILIQTRWHEDDLGGRILAREAKDWHIIKLPMLAGETDPLGRKPGERLWPEFFTSDMVERAQRDVRAWNALYQQDPVPDSGDYFRREDLREYDSLPEQLHIYGASDYAVTEGVGDFTEHGVFGLDFNGDIYVIDWWYGQTKSDVWIDRQCDLITLHRPLVWFGESGPIRKAIEPFPKTRMNERHAFCRLEWLASITDKETRAKAIQGRVAMGKVWFPRNARWNEHVISSLVRFPAGKIDDPVDTFSLIGRGLEHIRRPDVRPPPPPAPPLQRSQYAWMA